MQGKVKWFSDVKGYGFVVDGEGIDHHFHVSDVRGAALPATGASVTFEPGTGRRGPKAREVRLVQNQPAYLAGQAPQSRSSDDRVPCASCNRRMVPRIITGPPVIRANSGWTPVPKRSICPFCGATYKKFPLGMGEKIGLAIFFGVVATVFIVVASRLLSR